MTIDYSYDTELFDSILQFLDNENTILNLGDEYFSQVFKKNNYSFDDYSISESSDLDQLNSANNYDTIFLGNLTKTNNPQKLIQYISHVFKTAQIIGFVSNFSHVINIGKILDGNFLQEQFIKNNKNLFNLDSLILFLNKSGYSVSKLIRIKKEIDISNPKPLKDFTYNPEILESLLKDPESTTLWYVFLAMPDDTIDVTIKQTLSQYPKNIMSESLKNSFDKLKQKIAEDEAKIKYLENAIQDKDAYEKGLEQKIHQNEEELDTLLSNQKELEMIKRSTTWKLLRKLDKLRGK